MGMMACPYYKGIGPCGLASKENTDDFGKPAFFIWGTTIKDLLMNPGKVVNHQVLKFFSGVIW